MTLAVELKNVTLYRNDTCLLDSINFQVEQGSCAAVLGPNGAGKSALIAVLGGYIWPTNGSVSVLGQRYGHVNLTLLRRKIGLIEPSRMPGFHPHTTALEIVATGVTGSILLLDKTSIIPVQWQHIDAAMEKLGLTHLAEKPFGILSTGERTKILIARALAAQSEILILDEPTAGLDIGARMRVIQALEELLSLPGHPTLIVVSHHIEELPSHLDNAALLKNGRIIKQGKPEQTLTTDNLTLLFDYPLTVMKHKGRFVVSA